MLFFPSSLLFVVGLFREVKADVDLGEIKENKWEFLTVFWGLKN